MCAYQLRLTVMRSSLSDIFIASWSITEDVPQYLRFVEGNRKAKIAKSPLSKVQCADLSWLSTMSPRSHQNVITIQGDGSWALTEDLDGIKCKRKHLSGSRFFGYRDRLGCLLYGQNRNQIFLISVFAKLYQFQPFPLQIFQIFTRICSILSVILTELIVVPLLLFSFLVLFWFDIFLFVCLFWGQDR